jgi:hypothetical protein
METANRTFVEITGMNVAEFVNQCNAEGIEPIAEAERAIRALAVEGDWELNADELDELIGNAKREILNY